MSVQSCPNCEHENAPGEQFCARCGVPLNLKPCPACGKVHGIDAKACSGCGAEFPAAAMAVETDIQPATVVIESVPPVIAAPQSAVRPWPLIIVAVVAGGIPLAWMYRHNMPLPKAWQPEAQVAPAKLPPAAVPPPAPSPAVAQAPATVAEPLPIEHAEPAPQPASAPVAAEAKPPASKPKPPAKPASAPARECTEALAAVGLCNPKAVRQ